MIELDVTAKWFRANYTPSNGPVKIYEHVPTADTQMECIRKHLLNKMSLTGIQALNIYGCYRLSSIINRLRKQGMDIETNYLENDRTQYAIYKLKEKCNESQ